jgi:colanic acid/amylovoran biosynthesis glycosyltransferase
VPPLDVWSGAPFARPVCARDEALGVRDRERDTAMTAGGLRIAMLVPSFPELTNVFILNQITGLLDRGHDVDVFAVHAKSFDGAHPDIERYDLRARMQHIPVPASRSRRAVGAAARLLSPRYWSPAVIDALDVRRHGKQAANLVRLYTALSFLHAGPYDVLHAQFGNLGPAAERLVRLRATRAKLVTSFRGADASIHLPARPERFRDLFRRGDLFLPVSEDFRRVLERAGVPHDRVYVLRSGISLERFTFDPRTVPAGRTTLLFVGRLTEKKGVAYLLDAMKLLSERGRDVELVVIGDGPLGEALRGRSRELRLEQHVRFVGKLPQDDVIEAMYAAHVLVAPSVTAMDGDQEGVPNVVKEAMATGMPVVSTVHGGIPELVEHGVSGLLAPERDSAALAASIEELLDHPERWPAMGAAARAIVERDYDRERLNDRLVELYRSVCEQPSGARSARGEPRTR